MQLQNFFQGFFCACEESDKNKKKYTALHWVIFFSYNELKNLENNIGFTELFWFAWN